MKRRTDIAIWIAYMRARRGEFTDPDDLQKYDAQIEHLVAEQEADPARTMATMLPEGTSRIWGGGHGVQYAHEPHRFEDGALALPNSERESFYANSFAALPGAVQTMEMETERMFVGKDGLAFDGMLWFTVKGRDVGKFGGALPEGGDEDGWYAVGRRLAQFQSYKDGLIVGEDLYMDHHVITRKV